MGRVICRHGLATRRLNYHRRPLVMGGGSAQRKHSSAASVSRPSTGATDGPLERQERTPGRAIVMDRLKEPPFKATGHTHRLAAAPAYDAVCPWCGRVN